MNIENFTCIFCSNACDLYYWRGWSRKCIKCLKCPINVYYYFNSDKTIKEVELVVAYDDGDLSVLLKMNEKQTIIKTLWREKILFQADYLLPMTPDNVQKKLKNILIFQ